MVVGADRRIVRPHERKRVCTTNNGWRLLAGRGRTNDELERNAGIVIAATSTEPVKRNLQRVVGWIVPGHWALSSSVRFSFFKTAFRSCRHRIVPTAAVWILLATFVEPTTTPERPPTAESTMGVVKQRKNAKKKAKAAESASAASTAEASEPPPPKEDSLWDEFFGHPLIVLLVVVLVPFTAYRAFYFLELQRPDIFESLTLGLLSIRPSVRLDDRRQVLLLAPMSSLPKQLEAGMRDLLGLEFTSETTNTQSFFSRDGTVSSWLAVQYLDPLPNARDTAKVVSRLCLNRTNGLTETFHPRYYRPSNCTLWSPKRCAWDECIHMVQGQWGCQGDCATSFVHTITVAQHPIRTIQEIAFKVCPNNQLQPHPIFKSLAGPWNIGMEDDASCLDQIANYVLGFYATLKRARQEGWISSTILQVEEASFCDVAETAGFLDPFQVVYGPNEERLQTKCGSKDESSPIHQPMHQAAKTEKALPKLNWKYLKASGKLEKLCNELGYDIRVVPGEVDEQTTERKEVY